MPVAAALMLNGEVRASRVIVPGFEPVPVPLNAVDELVAITTRAATASMVTSMVNTRSCVPVTLKTPALVSSSTKDPLTSGGRMMMHLAVMPVRLAPRLPLRSGTAQSVVGLPEPVSSG